MIHAYYIIFIYIYVYNAYNNDLTRPKKVLHVILKKENSKIK